MIDENNRIIGSVRAKELDGTVYIGKLMVHPDYRRRGFASRLMTEIENHFPNKRYELFTSTRSIDNIRLYTRLGYKIFDSKVIDDELEFVFMEKVCDVKGKVIYVDYAHNPAGVETVLKEFKKLFGDFTTVITVSSESGYRGDVDIFNSVLKFSKFIVPASVASHKIALEKLHDNPKLNDRIFLNHVAEFKKTGTLGASKEEVRDGLRKALNLDCEMVIAIGEAATKYKSLVFDL